MSHEYVYGSYSSPVGGLFVAMGPRGITSLTIGEGEGDFLAGLAKGPEPSRAQGRFSALFRLLDKYFRGAPVVFSVPVDPSGTAFDKRVWGALSALPWGSHTSYGELASVIGKPGAARAVGGACGRNPIPLIIPCHRVLQSGGLIGGYSGGAGVKERLLAIEGVPFKAR
jgi:O-6-methylguanine DNA methyltransferase